MVYGTSGIEGLWNGLPANPAGQLEQDADRDQIMDCSDIATWERSYQRSATRTLMPRLERRSQARDFGASVSWRFDG